MKAVRYFSSAIVVALKIALYFREARVMMRRKREKDSHSYSQVKKLN
jgi:hypothetical protein